jgi:homogentisate 1,2-dioxygenase
VRVYAVEGNSHIAPARRYLSRTGQLLEHAPFCERDLRGPQGPGIVEGENVEVYIKHRGNGPGGIVGTVHTLPHHPFDVVGWDGCLGPSPAKVDTRSGGYAASVSLSDSCRCWFS